MADEMFNRKGRSASICAPGSSSMETLIQQQIHTSVPGTPGSGGTPKNEPATPATPRRRGKPAARSQSARIAASGRSVRRKPQRDHHNNNNNQQPSDSGGGGGGGAMQKRDGSHYSSEPRLHDNTPEPSPGIRRRGSRRGVSVYHPRKSTAFLDVPDNRYTTHGSRSDDGSIGLDDDPDSYRIRSFSSTSKGIVNRGDSFRRRRSRSSSLCPGHHALPLGIGNERGDTPPRSPGGIRAITVAEEDGICSSSGNNGIIVNNPNTTALNNSNQSTDINNLISQCTLLDDNELEQTKCYHVALIGAPGVGKTALISQFMTSECINAYDRQNDIPEEQTISVMLNGEESELHFMNKQNSKDIDKTNSPDAFVFIYSVVDRLSFSRIENDLRLLHDTGLLRGRPIVIVANKIDLARSRAVTSQDGKCLACTYRAKFIEVSVGINHNVDELLVGILNQIRLKEALGNSSNSTTSGNHWYKSRGVVRASMKARQMFTWIFGKEDSKFKNCENLHIL